MIYLLGDYYKLVELVDVFFCFFVFKKMLQL